jgi:hypothetical protein
VSTRKLIAVALLCGLAILVAGGIQLFRISRAEETTVPGVGDRVVVEGYDVTVDAADVRTDRIEMVVEMTASASGSGLEDVAGSWSVSTGNQRNAVAGFGAPPTPPECPAGGLEPGQTLSCSLAFERGAGPPVARFTPPELSGAEPPFWVLTG